MSYKDKPIKKVYLPHLLRLWLSNLPGCVTRYTKNMTVLEIEGPCERYELFENKEVKNGE